MAQDVVLTPESARRVARAVRAVERMTRGPVPCQGPSKITRPCRYAITSSAITAGNQSTKVLGSGTGTLQLITPTVVSGVTTYPYAALPGAADVVILNGGDSIASGRLIQVKVIDDLFNVDVDYC